jgi:hypothetical protein
VRPATGNKVALNDSVAKIAVSDSDPVSFFLPGVTGLARCLPFGDELPASKVTQNGFLRILVHIEEL